ncbi:MAG: GNAT family N-acetyltransferase [Clostridiales bacterium]|nr:GNAT family N-acetyltransferase [Clostridiales bacterium]
MKKGLIIIRTATYKGRADEKDYERLMSFLDEVFFTDKNGRVDTHFVELLPKLYKRQYNPCKNNFVVKEGKEIKGAAGLFYSDITVCGQTLKCGGIGNVCVAEDSRSKGYMKDCMNMALKDMVRNSADLGFLGGQRQRYAYFSFEPAGISCDFSFNTSNIKHCFEKGFINNYEVKRLTPKDTYAFREIEMLLNGEPFYIPHEMSGIYDVFCSWSAIPYAIFDSGVFKGFFTVNKELDDIVSYKAVDRQSLKKLILAAFEVLGTNSLTFRTPAFYKDAVSFFSDTAESLAMRHSECYTVLNFERVTQAFLELQASVKKLCSGSVVLLIHGFNGDERLELSVEGGKICVAKSKKACHLELSHVEAVRLLFSLFSNERELLAPQVQQWFPLPLHSYSFDGV